MNRHLLWNAWQNLKLYHRRPSEDLQEHDALAAYCVDNAVRVFGVMVENALQERVKTGTGKDATWKAKYELAQLLEPSFTLPRPMPTPKAAPVQNGLLALLAMAKQRNSGVKLWGVKPS